MTTKTILLEDIHIRWIESNSLNFSKWVRKKIDEEIRRQKEAELKSRGMCTGTPDF